MADIELMQSLGQEFKVLFVEDDPEIRELLSHYFSRIFGQVDSASDGQEGLERFRTQHHALVITDIQMPYMNGLEMIAEIKSLSEETETMVVTAFNDTRYMVDAIRLGINNYILKPIDYNQMNLALYKSITRLRRQKEHAAYRERLEMLAGRSANELLELKEHSIACLEKTLDAVVDQVDGRCGIPGHSRRVASYAARIAGELECGETERRLVERAAMVHDIGKVALPDSVIRGDASTLDDTERALLQSHVVLGTEILNATPYFSEEAAIAASHHEHFDGSGYPEGRSGDALPLTAHILIAANAFDLLSLDADRDAAIEALKAGSGSRFHPDVVVAALRVL